MITLQQSAELNRLISDYVGAEYEVGFYNAQAYTTVGAGETERKRCRMACSRANDAHHAMVEYMATLLDLEGVLP